MITVSQFPMEQLPEAWRWLQQFPNNNFDDYGPKDFSEFKKEMYGRLSSESIFGVSYLNELVGAVGVISLSPQVSMLHGICFDKAIHGSGIAAKGVGMILADYFKNGASKVCASYFADNLVVHRFLSKLGFVEEGYFCKHTTRKGVAVDMRFVSLFAGKF